MRALHTRDFSLDVRSVTDSGAFAGYASVFGNIDSYGDVIAPGAFSDSLTEWQSKGTWPPCLWQHRSDMPLGPFTAMREDDKGLYVEGQLLVKDVAQSREAHALLKSKTISGLSIGFEVIADAFDTDTQIRTLTRIKLWEASLVTFPANEAAQVESIKARLFRSRRDFETVMREQLEMSKRQAERVCAGGWAALVRDEEPELSDAQVAELSARMASLNKHLRNSNYGY